jgi:hypothetical protein
MLYHELKRRGQHAPKNKIYYYMKSNNLVKNDPKKQKKSIDGDLKLFKNGLIGIMID